MSTLIYHSDKRRLLPKIERFESYQEKRAIRATQANSSNFEESVFEFKDDDLEAKITEWKVTKSKFLAGEILSHAIVTENLTTINQIKNFLKDENDPVINWLLNEEIRIFNINEKIAINRKKLISEPRDAVTWMDQAINYFELGEVDKAKKCLESVLTINKDAGFLVRNASRLYSFFGDNGKSIDILKKSEYYKYDPQILSAEIAFSQIEERRTRGIDFGRRILVDSKFSNYQNSELAGAIGTLEHFDGNYKKSEKLFDRSLLDSTENSFAQSLWYKREPIPQKEFIKYESSNEIQAHRNANIQNYDASLAYAKGWIDDELYSIRPYRTASHIQGVMLGDYEEAYKIFNKGVQKQKIVKEKLSSNEGLGYYNDLAYFLLKASKTHDAEKYLLPMMNLLHKMDKLEDDEHIYLATLGLWMFHRGDIETGRTLYRKSIDFFKKSKRGYDAGSAFLNLFEEELKIDNNFERLTKLKSELNIIVTEKSESDLVFLKEKLLKEYRSYTKLF